MRGVRYLSFPPGSGFGEAAEDYITALRDTGMPVSWTPLEWGTGSWGPLHALAPFLGSSFGPYRHDDICNLPIDYDTMVVHSPPLWYEPWSNGADAARRVACTTYETDRLPAGRVEILNRYDMVLVPSTQNLEVFRDSGVEKPIRVIPHISRPVRSMPPARFSSLDDDLFVFYVIGTWTARKALPETIAAFLDAFTADDRVALVVKTTATDRIAIERLRVGAEANPGPHYGSTWWTLAQLLRDRPRAARIHLLADDVAPEVIDELHTRGDCFVSLSRGEGWSLGPFDAAAHGNPVVVTGWGGHLDFLPPGYPYLVDYELVPSAEGPRDDWFHPEPSERWAEPNVAQASALLRHIYEHRDEAREWGLAAQAAVTENFSAERVGAELISALREVSG